MSRFSPAARAYAWKHLFYHLGLNDEGGFFRLGGQQVHFYYDDGSQPSAHDPQPPEGYQLVIQACPPASFELVSRPETRELTWLPRAAFLPHADTPFPLERLPILFWGDPDTSAFASIQGRRLSLHADILAAAFFMLSRYEEAVNPARDKHGRHPFSSSVTSRFGLIDLPIVDYYAMLLKIWLQKLTSQNIPAASRFSFSCTHDIDYLYHSHPLTRGLGALARDLLKGRLDWFAQDLRSLVQPASDDIFFNGLQRLVQLSRETKTRDTFFLLTHQPHFSRDGYSLKSRRTREALSVLLNEGEFELGLHASYRSFQHPELYAAEKNRLEAALGRPVGHARQHFLRISTPHTWRAMQAAGLICDESYSYAEHEGFRCGTCYPYQVFDVLADRELDLFEKPLIVMDNTLKSYRQLSLEQAEARIFELAGHCRDVGGCFTLLWHNTSLSRDWQAWGERLPGILARLARMSQEDQSEE